MKLYTDASRSEGVTGIGYVIILKTGTELQGKHYIEEQYTSMEAEWYAFMQGLDIAQENITNYDDEIEAVVDCHPLVEKIREPNDMYDDTWYEYRKQALAALMEFDEWDMVWEERKATEMNEKADRLAREALWEGRDDEAVHGGQAAEGVTFE